MALEEKIRKVQAWASKRGNTQRQLAKALGVSDALLSSALNIEAAEGLVDRAIDVIDRGER